MPSCQMKTDYLTINQVFEVIIQQIYVCFSQQIVLKGFYEGLLTEMILIILQKAFDTMNRMILLQKLI